MAELLVVLQAGGSSVTLPLGSQETFELQLHFAAAELAEKMKIYQVARVRLGPSALVGGTCR